MPVSCGRYLQFMLAGSARKVNRRFHCLCNLNQPSVLCASSAADKPGCRPEHDQAALAAERCWLWVGRQGRPVTVVCGGGRRRCRRCRRRSATAGRPAQPQLPAPAGLGQLRLPGGSRPRQHGKHLLPQLQPPGTAAGHILSEPVCLKYFPSVHTEDLLNPKSATAICYVKST